LFTIGNFRLALRPIIGHFYFVIPSALPGAASNGAGLFVFSTRSIYCFPKFFNDIRWTIVHREAD
jgi:hypothetical protein